MEGYNKERVFETVLKLEVNKGHLKWTISDLARFSEQTRTSIYYHHGKDQNVILHEAWEYMLQTMFVLNATESLGIRKRLKDVIKTINEHPYLFVLFFLEKRKDSEIGNLIRTSEKKLINNLKNLYPKYSETDILKIYLCELGAIAYQELDNKNLESIFPK